MDIGILELADRQLRDYRRRTPGTYFAEAHPPLQLEEAYRVQSEIALRRSLDGEPVAGYKIGCIGPKIQEQVGLKGPIGGFLFGTELHPSGARLSHSAYFNLAIEGEMALRLNADGQISFTFPVIELHNYVVRAPVQTLQELIVNNGLNAGIVLPAFEGRTWRSDGESSESLEVVINETLVGSGPLWGMAGGPEKAVEWLRQHLRNRGLALTATQIVLTGTMLGLYRVTPGDHIKVTAGSFGVAEATVVS